MNGLRPYPRMKDSGVDWLGEVPSHWGVHRLAGVANVINGHPFDSEHFIQGNEGFPLIRIRDLYSDGTELNYGGPIVEDALVNTGDVIVGMDGAFNVARWRGPTALLNQRMCCIRPSGESLAAFLSRAIQTPLQAIANHTPSTTVKHLSSNQIRKIYLPIPPLLEQAAIVRFLGHLTSRIDRYVRAKEKQISLIEEHKRTIIHEAVTGGIDVRTGRPYAAYKTSDLEWLERLPAHWSVARNGQLFVQRNEVGYPELPILEVSLRSGVTVRDFESTNRKQVMSDHSMYKRAVKGDVAYNMMRMWQGAVGVAPVDGLVSPAYVVAEPAPTTEPRYFDHLYHTSAYMTEVNKHSRGIVADRNRLYWEDFKQIPAPCPSPDEQCLIADYIDHQANSALHEMRMRQDQVRLAEEYRIRIVSDVVTGKLDVRDLTAGLVG